MIFYIIPIILSFLIGVNRVKFNQFYYNRFVLLFVFLVSFIYCSGYMTGSDWKNYELLYDKATWDNWRDYEHEKGFYLTLLLFKTLGFSFFAYSILFKFLVFHAISFFLYKNSTNFYLSFALFLSTRALFLFVDCPFRFMCACGIIVYSYRYLIDRKIFKFALLVLIAMCFHISSVIMFFVYLVMSIKIYKINRVFLAIAYLVMYIVISPQMLVSIISMYIPSLAVVIETYYMQALDFEVNKLSVGNIFDIVLFITILLYRDLIISKTKKEFYSLSVIALFISLLGFTMPTIIRLIIMVVPFIYITISTVLDTMRNKFLLYKYFIMLYFIASPISQIYTTYVYMPYTNYFVYLLKDDIKYSDRSRYNKDKYFERVGQYPND